MSHPAPPSQQIAPGWDDLAKMAASLARRLEAAQPAHGSWQGIVAIVRGGLVPAAWIARALDIRLVDTLCLASYGEERDRQDLRLFKTPDRAGDGAGWLVIDDLADTGATFRAARTLLPQAHFACLYVKPQGAPAADSFVETVAQDVWVHFPWEEEPP